jgi:geranylgeranyl diphosphate synthase type II
VSTTAAELHAWLEAQRREVEAALDRFVPAAGDAPSSVLEAMRYALLGGGKRLRPMLALAAAEATAERLQVSADEARALALPAACALEMIHTYSLVHDDLPAMDNDTMRRGRPTTHVVFGDGMAILAGDGLLTDAFALLAREPHGSPSVTTDDVNLRKLRTVALIAGAAGAAGMVGGQALDLRAASPAAPPLDPAALRDMHARKTGALIHASAVAGAIMAGGRAEHVEAIGAFGRHIGLAFQIVDDVLDIEGASADLGKTAGKDAAAGKPTYPALYGLAESKRLAARCLDDALAALAGAAIGGQLPAIGRWVVGRTN